RRRPDIFTARAESFLQTVIAAPLMPGLRVQCRGMAQPSLSSKDWKMLYVTMIISRRSSLALRLAMMDRGKEGMLLPVLKDKPESLPKHRWLQAWSPRPSPALKPTAPAQPWEILSRSLRSIRSSSNAQISEVTVPSGHSRPTSVILTLLPAWPD